MSASSASSQNESKSATEMTRLIPQGNNNNNNRSTAIKGPYDDKKRMNGTTSVTITAAENEEDDEEGGMILIIAFLAMLVFSLGNRIFGRLLTYPMHNYAIFMNLLCSGVFIPLCFAYIIPVQICSNKITKEQTDIPKYQFGVMGLFDSIAGIMSTFATNYISNASTMVLVTQSAIPISMFISKISLNAQYTTAQYVGAAIVLSGIVVVLIPGFFATPAVPGADATGAPTSSTADEMQAVWIGILVASCVPSVMSSVYKEKALGETEIDIMYLNGWVAVFQFIVAIPLCIPSASLINVQPEEIWPNVVGGAKCMAGINTVTEDYNPYNQPLDDCSMGPVFVGLFIFFNAVYNFLVILILQIGSSNILYMSGTVIVPLSNVAFSLNFMPGHKPLKTIDIYGLFIIMAGLVVYRFSPQLRALWDKYQGLEDEEDLATVIIAKKITKSSRKKQARYYGLNQVDALETLIDSRIRVESKRLVPRNPGQIRGDLFYKLGIPPSPHVSFDRGGSRQGSPNMVQMSPGIIHGTPTLRRDDNFRRESRPPRGPGAYVDTKGRPQYVGNKVPGHGPSGSSKKYSSEV